MPKEGRSRKSKPGRSLELLVADAYFCSHCEWLFEWGDRAPQACTWLLPGSYAEAEAVPCVTRYVGLLCADCQRRLTADGAQVTPIVGWKLPGLVPVPEAVLAAREREPEPAGPAG